MKQRRGRLAPSRAVERPPKSECLNARKRGLTSEASNYFSTLAFGNWLRYRAAMAEFLPKTQGLPTEEWQQSRRWTRHKMDVRVKIVTKRNGVSTALWLWN